MSMISSTSFGHDTHDCGIRAQSTELLDNQFQSFNPIDECTDTGYILNSYPKEIQKICCNMFTTPKFCEWLKYEWLYSSIDKEIFLRVNDFQLILREHFPTLKSRKLSRAHWSTIRRIIGRPRRFSATFLSEERHSVQAKRKNIQYIQHIILKSSLGPMASEHLDNLLLCLPPAIRIPLRLPVGIRVCVCLHTPMQGLYLGLIQNSCPGDGHYAVWVDELIISNDYMEMKSSRYYGCQIVPEENVFPLPNQSLPPSVTLSEIRNYFKENMINSDVAVFSSEFNTNFMNTTSKTVESSNNRLNCVVQSSPTCGPLLSESIYGVDLHIQMNNSQVSSDLLIPKPRFDNPSIITSPCSEQITTSKKTDYQSYNRFFINIIKLHKILEKKRSSIKTLRQLNDTAEIKLSENQNNITIQFQHTYATLILNIDKINRELKHYMNQVLLYVSTMAQEHNMIELNSVIDWRRRCDDEAQEIVNRMKDIQTYKLIDEDKLDLVAKLISILIHLSNLSDHRYMNQIPTCIDDILKEIKHGIHPNNLKCFESTVENLIGQILNSITNTVYSRMYQYPMMLNSQITDNI
uniref:Putative lin-9 n=1 Tax=Schistosoma mansoni TaxID=6183 RepID=A0A3Q0KM60_SCHMA